jgi:outer membrane immunogenic protein
MRRAIAAWTLTALAAGIAPPKAIAQATADSGAARQRAGSLTSFPVSRRSTTRPIPYGHETVTDELSISVVPYNWQGLYLGMHGGGAWAHTRSTNTAPFGGYDAGVPLGFTLAPSGAFIGGQVGGLLQSGNWVYGAELDFGQLGLDQTRVAGDDLTAVRYDWYGALTGRLGFAWDHALYYIKLGGALARIRNTASDLTGGAFTPTDVSQATGTRAGWAAGAGIEYGLGPNWSAKLEYLYMDFGSVTSSNLDGDRFHHDNSVHTIKLGVNYRFATMPLFIRW